MTMNASLLQQGTIRFKGNESLDLPLENCLGPPLLHYENIMTIIGVISTVVTIPTALLIMKKTRNTTEEYRRAILSNLLCTFVFDFLTTILIRPRVYLPEPIVHVSGLFRRLLETNTFFTPVALYCTFLIGDWAKWVTIIIVLYQRSITILPLDHWLKRVSELRRKIYWTVGSIFVFHLSAAAATFGYDQEMVKMQRAAENPCLLGIVQSHDVYVLPILPGYMHSATTAALLVTAGGIIICLFFLVLRAYNKNCENRFTITRKKHEALLVAVSIQAILTFLCLELPAIVLFILTYTNKSRQIFTDISLIVMHSHSAFHAISTIFVHRDYRETVLCIRGPPRNNRIVGNDRASSGKHSDSSQLVESSV